MASNQRIDRREGDRTADAALIGVAAVWGITFPIIERVIGGVPTVAFLQARFLVAAILLAPIALHRRGLRGLLPLRSIPPGFLLAAGYLLQTEGLRTVGPSTSAFLTGTNVVLVPILAAVLRWERTPGRRWFGVLLALVGIALMQEGRLPDRWSVGESWTILCAVAFAGQIVLLGRLAPGGDPAAMATGQIVTAVIFLTLIGTASGSGALALGAMTGPAWLAALFTGALATAAAFFVQTWAQRRTPSGHVAVCLASESVFAALLSVTFFGDRLASISWIGAALLLAATLVVTTEGRRSGGS